MANDLYRVFVTVSLRLTARQQENNTHALTLGETETKIYLNRVAISKDRQIERIEKTSLKEKKETKEGGGERLEEKAHKNGVKVFFLFFLFPLHRVAVGTMSDYIRSTSGSFTYEEGPPLPFLGLQPLLRIASSQNEFPKTKEGYTI